MHYLTLARKLNMKDATIAAVESLVISEELERELTDALHLGSGELRTALQAQKQPELTALAMFLRWGGEIEREYMQKYIDPDIYLHTMNEIALWSEKYCKDTCCHGVSEWEWLAKVVTMRIFRIGRLEYEPSALERELCIRGECFGVGTQLLEIHIPEGEPLNIGEVSASLKMAVKFFQWHFKEKYYLLRCRSWLLSACLDEMLPANSGIIRFQNLFCLYLSVPSRQAEERVFGFISDDPSVYPEKTTLQRNLKQFLMDANTMTLGCGVITAKTIEGL